MFDSIFSKRGLSLDRLKTLLEVEIAGSISAAGKDPVRQSQYSRQLKELSAHFGTSLTARDGKRITLTPAGRRIATLSRQFLGGLENFDSESRGMPIPIRIGAGDSLVQWLAIPRIGERASSFHRFQFDLRQLQTREITEQLQDSRIDFGLMRDNAHPAGAKSAALGEMAYSIFIPKTLIKKPAPEGFGDVVREYPLALQVTEGEFTEHLKRLSEDAGVRFSPSLACRSLPQATAAVRTGGYASVLPTIAGSEFRPGSVLEIRDRALHRLKRKITLTWNARVAEVRPEITALAKDLATAFQLNP